MLDLIVTGGIAVLPSGAEPADIGVSSGKIAAIGAPGSLLSAGAARIVDASAICIASRAPLPPRRSSS